MDYMSVAEKAAEWGVSERSVRNYCASGRVAGACQAGRSWLIPSGAEKPARANSRTPRISPLLARLKEERESGLKGGIYHKVQVDLTYNSNHIEGSRLTHDQTRFIFETATVGFEGEVLRIDDLIETQNHFRAVDYVIDNAAEPLCEEMLKELHRILKSSTTDAARSWFAVGEYKKLENEVGGRATSRPEDVARDIQNLLASYDPGRPHTLEEILDFHVVFEHVHPFQDGNGRVGRLVMFKECLASGAVPFIIEDEMKAFYYRGLSEWDRERGFLTDTCLTAQDRFKAALDYFHIAY